LAVGFQGISELGEAQNARDTTTPHRFAESVVTLGEFKMPHRLESLDEMMWRYRYLADKDLYLCETKTNKE
jgi:CRISPR-associated protein Csy2